MLGTERTMGAPGLGAEPERVARAFRDRVLPCGIELVNRLERVVEAKFGGVRELTEAPPETFARSFSAAVEGIVSARPHRDSLVLATPAEEVRGILREARSGRVGASDLPSVAQRLSGAPAEVRIDVASELLHAAAPDRIALLSRWVWNPARRTGILGEFGGPPPETYAGTQARLAEIRLELDTLGFRSTTFAAVDVLLALTYAGRLGEAVDRSFHGGGLERLLPGSFPLATIVLGVRRRFLDADR